MWVLCLKRCTWKSPKTKSKRWERRTRFPQSAIINNIEFPSEIVLLSRLSNGTSPYPPSPHHLRSRMYTGPSVLTTLPGRRSTYNPTPSPHPLSSRSCTLRFFVVLLFSSSQSLLGGNSFRTDFRDPRFGEVLVSFLSLWLTRWMDPVIRLVQTRGIESLSVSVCHCRLRLTFPKRGPSSRRH